MFELLESIVKRNAGSKNAFNITHKVVASCTVSTD